MSPRPNKPEVQSLFDQKTGLPNSKQTTLWALATCAWIGVIFFSSTSAAARWCEQAYRTLFGLLRPRDNWPPAPLHFLADKGLHVSLFLILAILLWTTIPDSSWKSPVILVFGLTIGSMSEFLQRFFPGRDPAIRDVLINLGGTLIGVVACHTLSSRTRRKDSQATIGKQVEPIAIRVNLDRRPKVMVVGYGDTPDGEALYLRNDGDIAYDLRVEEMRIGRWLVRFEPIGLLLDVGSIRSQISKAMFREGIPSVQYMERLDAAWKDAEAELEMLVERKPLHIDYYDFDGNPFRTDCTLVRDVLAAAGSPFSILDCLDVPVASVLPLRGESAPWQNAWT
jgi:VanZ family protein